MLRTLALLLIMTLPLHAAKFPNAIIFGDSLSDEGRLYAATENTFPPSPFFQGRFCNGPLWMEYMDILRQNYAFSGAKSDYTNILEPHFGSIVVNTGLQGQIDQYLSSAPWLEDLTQTQYYINIGGNDFLAALADGNPSDEFIDETVDEIMQAAQRLHAAGAVQIMLIGLPDLSQIPFAKDYSLREKQILSRLSKSFNSELENQAEDHGYEFFDMVSLINRIRNNAKQYGFSNIDDFCLNEVTGEICSNPDAYFFWDTVHPTTRVQQIFANELE